MNKTKNKCRLGALDVFIIIVVIICAVSIAVRYFDIKESDVNNNVQLENYVLSFEIKNIKDSSADNYFEKGTNFYIEDSGELLGTLREGITVSDAVRYYEKTDGTVVAAPNTATGDLYRVDIEGSMDVMGVTGSDGRFLLGGNQYIALNKEIKVCSKYLLVTIAVTGITKAQ